MFQSFAWSTGQLYSDRNGVFPSTLSAWDHDGIRLEQDGTHFGYVHTGQIRLECESGFFEAGPGMYFCVPGAGRVIGGASRGVVITRHDCRGFFQLGGPVEHEGRLRYIDGCSDSLLIPPVVCGDPCLNLLYIPAGTDQTEHTHPSLRAGLIVSGRGVCRTPDGCASLKPGAVFVIPAETRHSFHTDEDELRVIAWHPDSDTGPGHDDHPMVNRTIVNGVSASRIPEIRT